MKRGTCPNILFIMADQFRWDCLGCTGNPVIRTPNLDRLAARGVRFSNAFTPNPICVPARATIMTGNYPHVCTGVKNNSGCIREGQPLLTEVLKAVGYRTYAVGKLHFEPYSPPGQPRLVHGFEHVDLHESGRILGKFDPEGRLRGLEDYFDYLHTVGWGGYGRGHGIGNNDVRPCAAPLPAEHYVDHWMADCTIRQLQRHQRETPDRPFFMFMSSPKPHAPYDPPRPFDQLYDPRRIPAPFGSAAAAAGRHPVLEIERATRAQASLSPEAVQVIRSYYYGSITFLDEQIGRVLAEVERQGMLDNTVVMFTADHGDLMGDFGAFFKGNHLNGSVRIPFLAAGPGVAQGAVCEALVGLQDILPTCAAAAGATIGRPVQGVDLSGVLATGRGKPREIYYAQTGDSPKQSCMVCDGEWKYIYTEWGAIEELYDQRNDPAELRNRAGDPDCAERLREGRRRLRVCAEELGDTAILSSGGFAASPLDREEIRRRPVKGMGWRWY
jgi:arylsulfatase A-like enzyme